MIDADLKGALWPARDGDADIAVDRINAITRRMASDIVEIGRILIGVKKALPHGSYLPWLKASFGWTERTATNFVNVAENIGENAKLVSHLPTATVYRLAAPSTPSPLLEGIFKRLEGGELVQRNEIDSQLGQVRRVRQEADRERRALEQKSPDQIKRAKARKLKEKELREQQNKASELARSQKNAARATVAAFLIEELEDETYTQFKGMMLDAVLLYATDLA